MSPQRPKGLKRLFVKGIERRTYSYVRQALSKVGVTVSQVKNILFRGDTLELLVFAEKIETIKRSLLEAGATAVSETPPLEQPSDVELRKIADRYGRSAARLPEQMHFTKKTLLGLKSEALAQAKALKQATAATEEEREHPESMDVEVEENDNTPINA